MASPDGSCVLIANGEIYNHHALRQRLGSCYPFQTQSDSEVVIASVCFSLHHCVVPLCQTDPELVFQLI